ncbi:putative thioesterase TR09 [Cladobotryum mycophilum]|uniref:Thioesterase TR09 n=1 Tax=Cladobotryum mycophilum TaxID=491253 RepID=A0ABR0SVQ2_9HYPO
MSDDTNPNRIQSRPDASHNLPLILMHDGSGLAIHYRALQSLDRDVWAIHRPQSWDTKDHGGGVEELARHYIGLIHGAGIKGKVILGGWSFGGNLSTEMARLLAEDRTSKITVAGLLLIDPQFDHLPQELLKTLEDARSAILNWAVPSWNGLFDKGQDVQCLIDGTEYLVEPGTVLYKPLDAQWTVKALPNLDKAAYTLPKSSAKPILCPPAVLLRCTDYTPTVDGGETRSYVDYYRDSPLLGWEHKYHHFIKAALEIKGNHYAVFDKASPSQMVQLTACVRSGLEALESIEVLDDFM